MKSCDPCPPLLPLFFPFFLWCWKSNYHESFWTQKTVLDRGPPTYYDGHISKNSLQCLWAGLYPTTHEKDRDHAWTDQTLKTVRMYTEKTATWHYMVAITLVSILVEHFSFFVSGGQITNWVRGMWRALGWLGMLTLYVRLSQLFLVVYIISGIHNGLGAGVCWERI